MHDKINKIAYKMNLPRWWIEAITIEYTDCRDFATRDEIWTFNFDKLTEKDIVEAIKSHNIVVFGTLFHISLFAGFIVSPSGDSLSYITKKNLKSKTCYNSIGSLVPAGES